MESRPKNYDKSLITKIVLTGGPCAGKTTAMTYISNNLRERGIKVLVVPEMATMFAIGGGLINIHKMTLEQNVRFQTTLTRTIMDMEDHFCELAEISDEQTVILCDRGVMDNKAYISTEGWQALMDENGFNNVTLRDKRYDAVIHMVTAADGAPQYYTLENNAARYETASIALDLDQKIRSAWVGHPSFIIVDNKAENFDAKIRKVYETVLHVIGQPIVPKFYKKYLLKDASTSGAIPSIPEEFKTETVQMDDTFVKSKDNKIERKVRRRGQKESYTYIYSITTYERPRDEIKSEKEFHNDGIEKKRQISAREYIALLDEQDEIRTTLKKYRQCFIYQGDYYFIDTFINSNCGTFSLLNIEATKDIESISLPPFLKIDKDVTDSLAHTSYEVSKKLQA